MSRKVSGYVYSDNNAHAAYFVHWTMRQVEKHGAHIDIIIGQWGDGTSAADRSAVSLEYHLTEDGPGVIVIDAHGRKYADGTLAKHALRRDDIVGKPVAEDVFAICDAILWQDERVAELPWE